MRDSTCRGTSAAGVPRYVSAKTFATQRDSEAPKRRICNWRGWTIRKIRSDGHRREEACPQLVATSAPCALPWPTSHPLGHRGKQQVGILFTRRPSPGLDPCVSTQLELVHDLPSFLCHQQVGMRHAELHGFAIHAVDECYRKDNQKRKKI